MYATYPSITCCAQGVVDSMQPAPTFNLLLVIWPINPDVIVFCNSGHYDVDQAWFFGAF